MPLLSRSRWALVLTCAYLPAVALLAACGSSGSDSTSPKGSVASADTVPIDQSTGVVIYHAINVGQDSGYISYSSAYGNIGDLVGTVSVGTLTAEYRWLLPFALPTLAGRGIVDSATVYAYLCTHLSNDVSTLPYTDSIVVD